MSGKQNALMKLVFPVEKFVGKDFDKGLAQLKQAVEQGEVREEAPAGLS